MKSRITILSLLILITSSIIVAIFPRSTMQAPKPSRYLTDRHGQFLAQLGDKQSGYGYWPLDELPQRVVTATLALEDHRFQQHPGVDPLAVFRALKQNITAEQRISGASTIAMQVARMQQPAPRTIFNKIKEALTAIIMTIRYGREEILKHYLRLTPYANQNHGINHAARFYLNKPVADLSWAEIAFLSAIPQAPSLMNPFKQSGQKRAKERGRRMLAYLHTRQVKTSAEWELAKIQLTKIHINPHHQRSPAMLHAILKLARELKQGDAPAKPRITTSLDLVLQEEVTRMTQQYLDHWQKYDASHAAVIITRRDNHEVLAWLGSGDYFSSHGSIDFAGVNRSPGSVLKPFIYAMALEDHKISPATILDDLYTTGGIGNADHRFLGPMLPRQALANSRNVPAISLLEKIGIDDGYFFLNQLGLHDNRFPAHKWGLSLAIGGLPTSLERIIQAYTVLADDGKLSALQWIRNQEFNDPIQIISPSTSRHISLMLADPEARLPSFQRMGSLEYPFPVAVKTGTSQGNRDAWTIAYSRDYLLGVWVGRHDARPMKELGGSSSAALLARKIMLLLHKDWQYGMADLSFPPPPNYHPEEICAYTGTIATSSCDRKLLEWFAPDQQPEQTPELINLAINSTTEQTAGKETPPALIKQQIYLNIPMKYKTWTRVNNMPPPLPVTSLEAPSQPFSIQLSDSNPVIKLTITSPRDGLKLLKDPTIPPETNSVALRVEVEPAVEQVVWYVDGRPFKTAEPPYSVRWTLQDGKHRFAVGLPFRDEQAQPVAIMVQ